MVLVSSVAAGPDDAAATCVAVAVGVPAVGEGTVVAAAGAVGPAEAAG
jgi:hypothetical protein